ncbi:MAG: hypothetical protein ABFS35_23270 [Bacteroidota bacterium]
MKILTKENLEVLIIDGLTVLGVYLIGEINLPVFAYTLIATLTALYAIASKEAPRNFLLQMFYAFGLFGAICTFSVLLFLLFDNSFTAAIIGLILGYIIAMSKGSGSGKINKALDKLYYHPTRVFIMPIVFNLFILGAESLFKYQISPGFAVVFMFFTYIPIRILLLIKAPFI